ncbi:MAG: hypothetical protein QOH05_2735 [Acetobacteraceae bacterium]|jgi:hypothetical protein|nr:hypothetical protein [Acetobacteraceae bacterium]
MQAGLSQREDAMSAEAFLLTGGCHCRALRYTVTGRPLGAYVCHCTDCQSLSGTAFAIGVVVPAAAFDLTGSPRLVRRVLGSGTISSRWICPGCGVWVCGGSKLDAVASADMRVVRGGTFDDTAWIRPTAHYWTRSAQPWVVFPEGVTLHATQPA